MALRVSSEQAMAIWRERCGGSFLDGSTLAHSDFRSKAGDQARCMVNLNSTFNDHLHPAKGLEAAPSEMKNITFLRSDLPLPKTAPPIAATTANPRSLDIVIYCPVCFVPVY
jgi:hypothetical protein